MIVGSGWGLVASVIFKITVTLQRKVGWVRFPHSPAIGLLIWLFFFPLIASREALSQQRDSARAGIHEHIENVKKSIIRKLSEI